MYLDTILVYREIKVSASVITTSGKYCAILYNGKPLLYQLVLYIVNVQ